MQRLQRKFGTFLPRTADESQVGAVMHEFFEADRMLGEMIAGSKAWRDAWTDILHRQYLLAHMFETVYKPVVGATEQHVRRPPGETPRELMQRTTDLNGMYTELKQDLNTELQMIDQRLINPAIEAKEALKPMKKTIKKREDKKLDYERYNKRAEALRSKTKRSDRDNVALAKHEADVERSTYEYHEADENLRAHLPRLTDAAFSILPRFLEVQIVLQNTLLSQLYTSLHNFCLEYSFPSPPPEMEEVVAVWNQDFTPLRHDLESKLYILQQGKAINQPMALPDKPKSYTGLNVRNGLQKRSTNTANQAPPPPESGPPRSSSSSLAPTRSASPGPAVDLASKPKISGHAMAMKPKPAVSPSPASSYSQSGDYFDNRIGRTTSNGLATPGGSSLRPAASNSSLATTASMSSIAGKKKPPPPPPKKIGTAARAEYVTAIYDFEAQQAGDLEFRKGDRIRIVKKTGSTADWWDGELRGVQGSFPANYVGVG